MNAFENWDVPVVPNFETDAETNLIAGGDVFNSERTESLAGLSMIELTHKLAEAEIACDEPGVTDIDFVLQSRIEDFVTRVILRDSDPAAIIETDKYSSERDRYYHGMLAVKEVYKEELLHPEIVDETPLIPAEHPALTADENDTVETDDIADIPNVEDNASEVEHSSTDVKKRSIIKDYLRTFKVLYKEDFQPGDKKHKAAILSGLATNLFDRSRLTLSLAIPTITRSYLRSGDQLKAGVTLGSIIYIQQAITGAMTRLGLNATPKTLDYVDKNVPFAKKYANKFVPQGKPITDSLLEFSGGFSLGTFPYVASEKLLNPQTTNLESLKTYNRVSLKIGALATGLTVGILSYAEKKPNSWVATDGVNYAKNSWVWLGIFGTILAGTSAISKVNNWRKSLKT